MVLPQDYQGIALLIGGRRRWNGQDREHRQIVRLATGVPIVKASVDGRSPSLIRWEGLP